MQRTNALLDDDLIQPSSIQANGQVIELPVDCSEGFTSEMLWDCLLTDQLPIYTGWPKRPMLGHIWLPSVHDRSASISDIYAHLKPKQIGHLTVQEFVKVNDSWVLHGKISYIGGNLLNHAALKPLRLIVHVKDIDRQDATRGRTLVNIVKVRTDPL